MRGARVVNFAIGIVVIAAFLNGLLLWQAAAEDFGLLDGTWEGDLKSIDLTGKEKPRLLGVGSSSKTDKRVFFISAMKK